MAGSMFINQLTFAGIVTKAGEVTQLPTGSPMGKFTIRHTKLKKDKTEQHTTLGVAVFGNTETMNNVTSLKEGDNVLVTGELSIRRWKDRSEQWQTTVEIFAKDFFKAGPNEFIATEDTTDDDVPF